MTEEQLDKLVKMIIDGGDAEALGMTAEAATALSDELAMAMVALRCRPVWDRLEKVSIRPCVGECGYHIIGTLVGEPGNITLPAPNVAAAIERLIGAVLAHAIAEGEARLNVPVDVIELKERVSAAIADIPEDKLGAVATIAVVGRDESGALAIKVNFKDGTDWTVEGCDLETSLECLTEKLNDRAPQ